MASTVVRRITILVVAYNEEATLPLLLHDILAQDYPHTNIELLLLDSMSNDGTRIIMQDFARRQSGFYRIEVLTNQGRYLPHGWNLALRRYSGDAIVRIDAHARISKDFISRNVSRLNSGEVVCGGVRPVAIHADAHGALVHALLAFERSRFGSSPASYRQNSSEMRYVGSVFHAAYRREVFERLGGFDTRLLRTEDNDMNHRIRKSGWQICLDPQIRSVQYMRSTFALMLRQKAANGFWVGITTWLSFGACSLMHYVPLCFVLGLLALLILALSSLFTFSWLPLALFAAIYAVVVLAVSIQTIAQTSDFRLQYLLLPVMFLIIHFAYGAATVAGLFKGLGMLVKEKTSKAAQTKDYQSRERRL
jgi:glycosyltransferase involved in cell wall biosynthesis